MDTKQELLEQHANWTVKYMNAKERLDGFLPPVGLSELGESPTYDIAELPGTFQGVSDAAKDMDTAFTGMKEIVQKLARLPWNDDGLHIAHDPIPCIPFPLLGGRGRY